MRLQVRWRDIDRLGHLNQCVYHEYLEEVRAALLTETLRETGNQDAHGTFVLAHVHLDYHAEVRREDGEVEVVARVGEVRTSSVRIEHQILRPDGTLAASGETVLVAWDPVSRSKRTLSDAELSALSGGQGSGGQAPRSSPAGRTALAN